MSSVTSEILDLDSLIGNDTGEDLLSNGGGSYSDPCEGNKYYKTKITGNRIQTSKFGQVQLELETVANGKKAKRWIPLPVVTPAQAESNDPAKLAEQKKKNAKTFHNFLKVIDAEQFQLVTKTKVGEKWFFYNSNGDAVDNAEAARLDKQTGVLVMGAIKRIQSGELSFVDKEVYYVRAKGEQPSATGKARYFDNFYTEAPSSRYEDGSAEASF